jgi:hypothetical protein
MGKRIAIIDAYPGLNGSVCVTSLADVYSEGAQSGGRSGT